MSESELTKEWSKYDPEEGYEKEMQDIKLFDGTVIMMCWPNAGSWNVCQEEGQEKYYNRTIHLKDLDAEFVRLTHSDKW